MLVQRDIKTDIWVARIYDTATGNYSNYSWHFTQQEALQAASEYMLAAPPDATNLRMEVQVYNSPVVLEHVIGEGDKSPEPPTVTTLHVREIYVVHDVKSNRWGITTGYDHEANDPYNHYDVAYFVGTTSDQFTYWLPPALNIGHATLGRKTT